MASSLERVMDAVIHFLCLHKYISPAWLQKRVFPPCEPDRPAAMLLVIIREISAVVRRVCTSGGSRQRVLYSSKNLRGNFSKKPNVHTFLTNPYAAYAVPVGWLPPNNDKLPVTRGNRKSRQLLNPQHGVDSAKRGVH